MPHLRMLRISNFYLPLQPCSNSNALGSATATATSAAESQPAAVRAGTSNHQLAASTVHHLTDAAGPAG